MIELENYGCVFHSLGRRTERFINALLEVNLKSLVRAVKNTDAVLLQTEPDTLYFTHFTVNRYDTTSIISSNTSLST